MRGRGDGEVQIAREELRAVEAFSGGDVAVDAYKFAAGVAGYIFLPRDLHASIRAKEVAFVRGEMR